MSTGTLSWARAGAWRRPERLTGRLLLLGDALCLLLAFTLATHLTDWLRTTFLAASPGSFYDDFLPQRTLQLYLLGSGLCLWFALKGHYGARQSFATEAQQLLTGVGIAALIDGYLQFALKVQPSRIWLSSTWLFAGGLLVLARVALKHALFRLGPWRCPTVLIGSPTAMDEVARLLGHDPYVGQVITRRLPVGQGLDLERELARLVASGACRYVLIAFDDTQVRATQEAARLVDERLRLPHGIVPALRDVSIKDMELHKFFGHDLVVLSNRRAGAVGSKLVYKRVFDLVGASLLLLFLSPLMLLVALLVRLDGGPALYGSPRIGREGRVFRALKFRSMVPNADQVLRELLARDPARRREWEESFKLAQDPRITPIGRFIRKTSIDELPQLLNVLKGEMSLVGPRPLLLDEREQYTGRAFELYRQVTPGLTGMWQVSGRDDLEYYRRIELNNWYIKNWSPWVDLVILCKTLLVVVKGSGAS
ncbi:exopolysaccharide biosynthesis polyprenyl glycosylphosphotransferase [Benzoatithermus flavus]|uniref:Exopolysaccharide biosynthesis polyprenyl glycosylphosphotransferase n=1 Tax=Benzoatithermus flavus TaxID=3108223 RepID=A0ABU8XXR4_9PROT